MINKRWCINFHLNHTRVLCTTSTFRSYLIVSDRAAFQARFERHRSNLGSNGLPNAPKKGKKKIGTHIIGRRIVHDTECFQTTPTNSQTFRHPIQQPQKAKNREDKSRVINRICDSSFYETNWTSYICIYLSPRNSQSDNFDIYIYT